MDRRRALRIGTALWAAPVAVAALAAPAIAASAPSFSFTTTNLFWELPKSVSNFFRARYNLVNDGAGPGKPVITFLAAAERLNLVIDQLDSNWVVSPGGAAYGKTLTWVGPDIPPGGTVVLSGTNPDLPGYFRGTVANNPPNLNSPAEDSNFRTLAQVTPAGANPSVFTNGDNYP